MQTPLADEMPDRVARVAVARILSGFRHASVLTVFSRSDSTNEPAKRRPIPVAGNAFAVPRTWVCELGYQYENLAL